jgi:hypothetical protein
MSGTSAGKVPDAEVILICLFCIENTRFIGTSIGTSDERSPRGRLANEESLSSETATSVPEGIRTSPIVCCGAGRGKTRKLRSQTSPLLLHFLTPTGSYQHIKASSQNGNVLQGCYYNHIHDACRILYFARVVPQQLAEAI